MLTIQDQPKTRGQACSLPGTKPVRIRLQLAAPLIDFSSTIGGEIAKFCVMEQGAV